MGGVSLERKNNEKKSVARPMRKQSVVMSAWIRTCAVIMMRMRKPASV